MGKRQNLTNLDFSTKTKEIREKNMLNIMVLIGSQNYTTVKSALIETPFTKEFLSFCRFLPTVLI